ncbi:MAG: Ig-like domain-containing protein [Leptospiraceae bacterium]|nr:Ig-like domain-containing protein [Leptospiraceae bacterium]
MKAFILFLVLVNCNLIPNPEKGLDAFFKFLSFREVPPLQVSSILPKDKTTAIVRNTNIFIGFNRSLVSFDEKNFSITDSEKNAHSGKITINDNFLTFTQDTYFKEFKTYTITIKKESGLSTDFTSSFATSNVIDNSPPIVTTTSPLEGEKDFPLNASIIFNFNEAIDPTSITSSTFTITGLNEVERRAEDSAAILKPKSNLLELNPYIVTIRAGIKDLSGNRTTSPYSVLFSTGTSIVNDSCVYDTGIYGGCLYK